MLNNALIPKSNDKLMMHSKPWQWPLCTLGYRMRRDWENDMFKIFLLGNPLIWWSVAASLVVFLGGLGYQAIKLKRWTEKGEFVVWLVGVLILEEKRYLLLGSLLLFGWIIHYVPFLMMSRVTYLHHCMDQR